MKKKKGKEDFIKRHEYPGGKKAFTDFINANLVYPKQAIADIKEGTVIAEYEVGFDGKVREVKIIHGIGSGCDEEAIRLIRLLKFAPQNNHGTKIISSHKMKLHFKLPEPPKPAPTTIKYELSDKKAGKEQTKKVGYSYSIKLKHP
jgi:TonB family protein